MSKILRRIGIAFLIIKYYIILLFVKLFRIKHDDVWLISERGDEARDNGYAFYRYLTDNHKEINKKYVISKKSSDINKINKEDIIYYKSIKHYIYYITSKYLISTHLHGYSPSHRAFRYLDKKGMLFNKGKQVFLQHGITHNMLPVLDKINNPSLSLFICGAKPEFEYLKKTFKYNDNEIKYTGFARFDYLVGDTKSQILLMPTWRGYLKDIYDKEFEKSEYFNAYNSLINNSELISLLEKNNIDLIFYPHYEMQKYLHLFRTNSNRIIIAQKDKYDVQKLLIESKLLITDFSSVFFDFAYMKKPVLYYHFDYDEFRKNHYNKGYFDYNENGFGDVIKTENELLNDINECIKERFILKDKYLSRIDLFFEHNDHKNCERIYNEIIDL